MLTLFVDYFIILVAMRRRSLAILLIAFLCSSPQFNVNACSVVMGYVRPTNYELVKEADAVVLANATNFEKKGKLRPGSRSEYSNLGFWRG
jgi:hypothetical protein